MFQYNNNFRDFPGHFRQVMLIYYKNNTEKIYFNSIKIYWIYLFIKNIINVGFK